MSNKGKLNEDMLLKCLLYLVILKFLFPRASLMSLIFRRKGVFTNFKHGIFDEFFFFYK